MNYTPFIVKKPLWNESGVEDYQKQSAEILQKLSTNYCDVEFLPILCELFSKALVISAEHCYETTKPSSKISNTKNEYPKFSKEYLDAHNKHKKVFSEWRKAGRPSDFNHPAKEAMLLSRRNIQKIAEMRKVQSLLDQDCKDKERRPCDTG